jgi:hypothetical protein
MNSRLIEADATLSMSFVVTGLASLVAGENPVIDDSGPRPCRPGPHLVPDRQHLACAKADGRAPQKDISAERTGVSPAGN